MITKNNWNWGDHCHENILPLSVSEEESDHNYYCMRLPYKGLEKIRIEIVFNPMDISPSYTNGISYPQISKYEKIHRL